MIKRFIKFIKQILAFDPIAEAERQERIENQEIKKRLRKKTYGRKKL